MDWILSENQSPEPDTRVLVIWQSPWGPAVTFGRHYPQWDSWSVEFPISGGDHKVIAWMPIPDTSAITGKKGKVAV